MSQLVAILLGECQEVERPDMEARLRQLCVEHGYGVSFGCNVEMSDVAQGLADIAAAWMAAHVAVLHAPADNPKAPEIGTDLEPGGDRAEFFAFLKRLAHFLASVANGFDIVFAISWPVSGRIRVKHVTLDELLLYLSRPCGWAEELYSPRLNTWGCDDEMPIAFRVRLREQLADRE